MVTAPGEHKTVQARILKYAQEIGWTYVPRDEAERRRGFDTDGAAPQERARKASLYFGDLLHSRIRAFNPKYKEAEGALIGQFQRFHADIYGNRDFLQALRNQHKFFCAEENRELDLTLIDYGDLTRPRGQWRNVYEVTEEFYTHNGKYGTPARYRSRRGMGRDAPVRVDGQLDDLGRRGYFWAHRSAGLRRLKMIWVTDAKACPDYRLRVLFSDNTEGEIDLKDFIASDARSIVSALRDQSAFSSIRVEIDAVVWANGFDLAPEFLYARAKARAAA